MVAEVQKRGGIAGYVDAEHAMDPTYAKALGVDIDNLYISQPDDGEQALEITETMVRSGAIDIVIVDSVAALVPRAEIEGEMGDKIGVTFGNPETTTGGRALKFYSSIRMEIRKADVLKQGTEIVGNRTKVKVAKNKVAPPFRTAEFDIIYGKGISKEGDILDLAADVDIVNKSGAWYAYKETRIGQGRENAKQFLREHPEMCAEIDHLVRVHYGLEQNQAAPQTAEAADAAEAPITETEF